MTAAALIAILLGMILLLIRTLLGPTLYDRVLAVNSFDIAILYAMINFVSTIAILKFFRYRSFQVPLVRRGGQGGGRNG